MWNSLIEGALSQLICILVLLAIFLLYVFSISNGRLPLTGHADIGNRFLIAAMFARDWRLALSEEFGWFGVWPPVPFIIQGSLLSLIDFGSMPNAAAGIIALQLLGVILTLASFYVIGRSVALQTNAVAGLLASLMCLGAPISLRLAHTNLSEVYALFFVAVGILNVARMITKYKGFGFCISSFALAFFCRTEALPIAVFAGLILIAHRRWRPGVGLIAMMIALASAKVLGGFLIARDVPFWGHGVLISPGNGVGNAVYFVLILLYSNRFLLVLTCAFGALLFYRLVREGDNPRSTSWFKDFKSTNLTASRIASMLWSRVQSPIVMWLGLLAGALGPLIEEALRENIAVQWRYVYLANVLMTTVIAVVAARAVPALVATRSPVTKGVAVAWVSIVVVFSIGSGIVHATGSGGTWSMPAETKELIGHIMDNRMPGDRVAYDFLGFGGEHAILAAHLLDPRLETPDQFSLLIESYQKRRIADEAVNRLVPPRILNQISFGQTTYERRVTTFHAYIHGKLPRFLVLPSRSRNRQIKAHPKTFDVGTWLHPATGMRRPIQVFHSPYVHTGVPINFGGFWENSRFVVLERLD
jgi:hypothetical protein